MGLYFLSFTSTDTRSTIPPCWHGSRHEELENLLRGYGWNPYFVEGSEHDSMHQAMAATLERCHAEIRTHQAECRRTGIATRPRWPMVVLRSPKGWGAPAEVDGHRIEAFWRSHQVPLADVKTNPQRLRILENWMRSLKPEELFDESGRLRPELAEIAPSGARRMSASPHANGDRRNKLRLPDFRDYAIKIDRPGITEVENVPPLGGFLRDVMKSNMDSFRVFAPDENTSNKLDAIYQVSKKFWIAEMFPEDSNGTELACGRTRHRNAQRAHNGRHARGLPAYRSQWVSCHPMKPSFT